MMIQNLVKSIVTINLYVFIITRTLRVNVARRIAAERVARTNRNGIAR